MKEFSAKFAQSIKQYGVELKASTVFVAGVRLTF